MKRPVWDVIKDLLVLLIIPAFAWIIKIEVQNATVKAGQAQQEKALEALNVRLEEYKKLETKIQEYALQEVRIEGKLDSVTEKLAEIKVLLNASK